MLKINDAMDKNYKEKSDKEPGFSRLEEHRKNLILNTSAVPPYDNPASQPTEFFMTFLAKKSQFKAKDMILHRLQSDKISFNPGSSFINSLWNCDFSGFCQITKHHYGHGVDDPKLPCCYQVLLWPQGPLYGIPL